MLIASLPYHGPLFAANQPPLSRIKLEERLKMLTDEDATKLRRIENLLRWRDIPISRSDAEMVSQARALLAELEEERLKRIVEWRLEVRTVIAALRRRHRGQAAPDKQELWGYGRWVRHIARNWGESTFRLEGVYPWLGDAVSLLRNNDTVGLERLFLRNAWNHLERISVGHNFDFEAVVIYVLRWNIIERWTRYNGPLAAERFQTLVDASLGQYASLFD